MEIVVKTSRTWKHCGYLTYIYVSWSDISPPKRWITALELSPGLGHSRCPIGSTLRIGILGRFWNQLSGVTQLLQAVEAREGESAVVTLYWHQHACNSTPSLPWSPKGRLNLCQTIPEPQLQWTHPLLMGLRPLLPGCCPSLKYLHRLFLFGRDPLFLLAEAVIETVKRMHFQGSGAVSGVREPCCWLLQLQKKYVPIPWNKRAYSSSPCLMESGEVLSQLIRIILVSTQIYCLLSWSCPCEGSDVHWLRGMVGHGGSHDLLFLEDSRWEWGPITFCGSFPPTE